jgi:hypothetical protein
LAATCARSEFFQDVTVGDNDTTWQVIPNGTYPPGFRSSADWGYDLASGWGSPRFAQAMMQILQLRE